jgi:hypothetical protein
MMEKAKINTHTDNFLHSNPALYILFLWVDSRPFAWVGQPPSDPDVPDAFLRYLIRCLAR